MLLHIDHYFANVKNLDEVKHYKNLLNALYSHENYRVDEDVYYFMNDKDKYISNCSTNTYK